MNKSWKMKARTGGVRRKLIKEYQHITDTQEIIRPTTSSALQNVTAANFSIRAGSVQNSSNDFLGSSACLRNGLNLSQDYVCSEIDNKNLEELYSSEDSQDEDYYDSNDQKNFLFREKIRTWAVEKNISQIALKDLATIMNEMIPDILPIDPRTILATPRLVNIKLIDGGEYWHNGIENPLKEILNNLQEELDLISLNLNFDGLPIFKSSKHEFWPILCNIHEKPNIRPFIIGIYFGNGKPKDLNSYLEDFIKDMKKVLNEGIPCSRKTISVQIRCFICDSPARAYIKGVCNFNGKHGCLKCVTIGEYSHNSHTVTFPDIDCPERTNEGFRNKVYGSHHKTDSPLLSLPIDMVKNFPVSDSLHLLDLGIMKRLLVGWRDGNFGKYVTKWRASDIEMVTNFLRMCKLPSEVHRAMRGLDCVAHWKASEFRSFFYYLSIIILPDVLKPNAFAHFLMLYCGVTICSSATYRCMLPVADKLLKHFVKHYKDFYGADYVTSNVHNLIHMTAEVDIYGPLQTFNAYPFENQLYMIKRMLRVGRKPLAQVAKRLAECNNLGKNTYIAEKTTYPFVKKTTKNRNVLILQDYELSSKECDSFFLTTSNDVIGINFIADVSKVLSLNGFKVDDKEDIFTYPIKSSRFNLYKSKNLNRSSCTAAIIDPKQIKCKLVCISYKEWHYFIPLIHTL